MSVSCFNNSHDIPIILFLFCTRNPPYSPLHPHILHDIPIMVNFPNTPLVIKHSKCKSVIDDFPIKTSVYQGFSSQPAPLITQGHIPLNPYHIPTMVDISPIYFIIFPSCSSFFVGYPTTIHHETVTVVIFPIKTIVSIQISITCLDFLNPFLLVNQLHSKAALTFLKFLGTVGNIHPYPDERQKKSLWLL